MTGHDYPLKVPIPLAPTLNHLGRGQLRDLEEGSLLSIVDADGWAEGCFSLEQQSQPACPLQCRILQTFLVLLHSKSQHPAVLIHFLN